MPKQEETRTVSDEMLARLDAIALHLERMDKRDRARMIGSTIKNVVYFGFLAVVIWSSVYFTLHIGDIIKLITEETAKQTMQYGSQGSQDMLQQLQQYLPKK